MVLPTPEEFAAYLAALQKYPFSALVLAATVIACVWALRPCRNYIHGKYRVKRQDEG
jgi:hypothetical protein